jgi:3-hydroxyisobutyrate dehydrogenase-like beta-hydroxyacid dehydrogenase
MGSAMARNLLRAGHQLTVYNRTRAKAESLAADGARVAGSPAEAARECEAAITMLADDAAVEEAVLGEQGLAAGLPAGSIHSGTSTISTALARRLAAEHSRRGQHYLSAPVFGRPDSAEAAKLLIVPAGPADAIARAQPIFAAVSRQTFIAGTEPWQANAVKLCGNFMIASMIESFGEAFAMLRKASVDPHLFLDVVNALFASPVYANYGRIIAEEQFEPAGFALKLGFKDVRLAIEASRELVSPMPFAGVLHDHFLSAIAHGQEDQDWSSLAGVPARDAGL